MKNKIHRVWIKNHNVEASFASVKLLLITYLVFVMLMLLTMILFNMNKWNEIYVFHSKQNEWTSISNIAKACTINKIKFIV